MNTSRKPSLGEKPINLAALILLILPAAIFFQMFTTDNRTPDPRQRQEALLTRLNREAPYKIRPADGDVPCADEPGMAAYHDFLMTLDPATGKVPSERMYKAYQATLALGALKQGNEISWQGYPSDMGGRTRAIMYDPNDPSLKKVWAGGITGGLWYNNDITSASSVWIPISDFWSNLSIRCLAFDPNNTQVFYAGTGEVETAMNTYRESSGLGFGIAWSTDGGMTWSQLPGTGAFAYVTDIVVRSENGASVLYAGVASGLYKGSQHQSQPSDGLFRSSDNGATWTQVLPLIPGSPVPYCVSDIALGADNRIYVGTRPNLDGEGAATLMFSDDGAQWTVNTQYKTEIENSTNNNIPGRVVLATAQSDANVVYALIASGKINASTGFIAFYCYHILRSVNKGITWVKKNLPNNLTSGNNFATIAWHALDIAVDPNHPDYIYAGGLDMHKSFNGGTTWIRISDWSKMYNGGGPDYIHADQHTIVYKPGSSDEVLFGSDGGVFYTATGTQAAPVIEEHNKGYSTLQVYACALHPMAGINQFYGGLQDNGSLFYIDAPLTINNMVSGGDGAYCFFDELDPAISITSLYYNQYYVFDNGNYLNGLYNWSSGTFVSPADYDYNNKLLFCNAVEYSGNHQDQILRLSNLTGSGAGTFLNLNTGTTVYFSAVCYSPYSPSGKATIYVGSQAGRLFRVAQAQSNLPFVTEIGSNDFPPGNISSIAIGQSEDTLMVTFSNYGVSSVWSTTNGGENWQEIEGSLPDMPVRWALYHPQDSHFALLATETGVWQCADIYQQSVIWLPVNTGMANVRVDMLQLRKADNTILAATHGRGFFTMTWDVTTGREEPGVSALRVYPNPARNTLTIQTGCAGGGVNRMRITDMTGREVFSAEIDPEKEGTGRQADISSLKSGVYLIVLESAEKRILTEKLIVNHH